VFVCVVVRVLEAVTIATCMVAMVVNHQVNDMT